ncbi:Arginine transport ATP-binding protein ArtP [Mannheimia haemolytica]
MAIRIQNVNFFYGSNQALFDINLEIEKGDTVVLLGPSGAGKSTLIRTLNLMEVPQSGTLAIANHQFDLTAKTDSKAVSLLRREVGMVFQQYHLWPHLTVMQNLIEAPMKVLGLSKEEAVARAKGHLARLRLSEFAERFPASFRWSATTGGDCQSTDDAATGLII